MSQKQYAYFSAAIREGAKLRPQCKVVLFTDGRSCAIGAGIEAATGFAGGMVRASLASELYPYLSARALCPETDCPMSGNPTLLLLNVLGHLNDAHDWTREQIAVWLYAEEEKLGFVTLTEETEAHKSEMIAEYQPSKATVPSSC